MKKAVLIFLSLIMVMALIAAGCNGTEEPAPAEVPAETPTETPAETPTEPPAETPAETPAAPPSEAPAAPAAPAEPATTEVLEFRLTSHYPEILTQPWVDSVAEATGGRVQIVVYASSSLMDLKDTVTGLKDGIADIAMVPCETFPETYYLNNVLTQPFLPMGPKETAYQVWHDLQDEFPELAAEWSGFQVLWDDTSTGNVLHTVKSTVKAPAEVDGLRMFSGATIGEIMEENGATQLYLEVPDWFTSLDRGLLDGMWLPWDAVWELSIYPLLPYHTTFPSAPGTLSRNCLMREEAWNTIPTDLQKAILDQAPAATAEVWKTLEEKIAAAKNGVMETGGTITDLTPEEVNAWYEAAKPYHDEYLAEVDAMGLPGTEVYNRAIELAAEYMAE